MLQVYDKNHIKVAAIRKYEDYSCESTLSTGDKTLRLKRLTRLCDDIEYEGYLRNKKDEFVIKELSTDDEYTNIIATLNIEDLEGKEWPTFSSLESTITECINLAIAGTGWIVGNCDVTKKRTIKKTGSNAWDIIQQCRKTYCCEIEFDTINKIINIYKTRGSDKGLFFIEKMNLKKLEIQGDTYDFYTRIRAFGATISEQSTDESGNEVTTDNQLEVTVENYSYSNKIKTLYWKDERYTDEDSLREDAELKLKEICQPKISYSVSAKDLGECELGDTIHLVSKSKNVKVKQRIVKMTEYEHRDSEYEISTSLLTFEDLQKEQKESETTLSNITKDDGTISEKALAGALDTLILRELNVNSLNALTIRVGELEATRATITQLNAVTANIDELVAKSATISELSAKVAKIDVLEATTATIQNLLAGTVTTGSTQTIVLNSKNTTIETALIKDAMIYSVSADKITTGTIYTNLVDITSDDGKILIRDNTMQFLDSNNYTRIQIGEDSTGNFNFIVRAEDGTTTLIDGYGIKEKAIADKLIKTKMINDKAITGDKIDYESFVSKFNASTNTNTINSSKVMVDGTSQSLYVAFNTLTSTVDNKEASGRNYVRNGDFTQNLNNWNINKNGNSTSNISVGTSTVKGWNYVTFTSVVSTGGWAWLYNANETLEYKKGKKYTISFYANANNKATTLTVRVDNASVSYSILPQITKNISTEWKKYTITFTNNKGDGSASDYPLQFGVASGGSVNIAQIKLEVGESASNYCQAYEDISKSIETNTTSISVMKGQISTLISQTSQITTNTDNITTLTTNYSSLNQTVNSLNTTVSSHTSSISNLNTTVSSHTSSISQLQSSIALKVESSDITAAINGLQIGGRNYVRNGDLSRNIENWNINKNGSSSNSITVGTSTVKGWNYLTFTSTISDGGWAWLYNSNETLEYKKGKKYTISFYANANNSVTTLTVRVDSTSGEYTILESKTKSISTEWTKYTITFTNNKGDGLASNYPLQFGVASGGSVNIAQIKLEEGEKDTTFTAAQEDIESDIKSVSSAVSELNVTTSGISSRVTSVETITSSHTTSISNLTTKVSTVEQNITADAIVAKVQTSLVGGTNSITTMNYVIDINGVHIKNGAFDIQNNYGTTVFSATKYGDVSLRGSIYNYDSSGNLRCSMTDYKCNYYDESGNYIGGIGNNSYVLDDKIKGLTIDLDTGGKFISFAVKENSSSSVYTTVLSYHRAGSFSTEGLNAGCNLDMHNYTINNVHLSNVQAGGYMATSGDFEYVSEIHGNSDGSIGWTTRTLKIREGIIVAA